MGRPAAGGCLGHLRARHGALVVGKLCSSTRLQIAIAAAIKEYGALRRTVYAARYLVDETYRRRIGRQLNKGENVHSLKRMLAYAGEEGVRTRPEGGQGQRLVAGSAPEVDSGRARRPWWPTPRLFSRWACSVASAVRSPPSIQV